MMTTATTNIYRSNGEWCHATWIDGEFDCSDSLDATTEAEAVSEVKSLITADSHEIKRVDDI